MRESVIEKDFCKQIKDAGGVAYKQVPLYHRGLEDRMALLPIKNEYHREIVGRYVRFVELKAPGEKPLPHQVREHDRKRELGYRVEVVDYLNYEV
jgi:hypothetical protein